MNGTCNDCLYGKEGEFYTDYGDYWKLKKGIWCRRYPKIFNKDFKDCCGEFKQKEKEDDIT